MVAWGYKVAEVPLKPLPEIKPGTRIEIIAHNPTFLPTGRSVAAVGLGVEMPGLARPHADDSDVDGLIKGVCKRSAMRPPRADPARLRRLEDFTHRFARKYFYPIDAPDMTLEAWLAKTNYPDWRKKQLIKEWEDCQNPLDPKYAIVKGFMKDEAYDDYKYPRLINPRHDVFKCLVGPVFKILEENILYKHPAFVKGIPRHKWADYVMSRFDATKRTMAGDFEAWEAHVTAVLQRLEFIIYEHVLGDHKPIWWNVVKRYFLQRQLFVYKYITVEQDAVRASGDQQTSLGNGLLNLLLLEFFAEEFSGEVVAVVEGDDSLSQWTCRWPTAEDYASVGVTIKIEEHDTVETASFCGLVFDSEDRVIVTDPLKMMAKFGWTTRNYAQSKMSKLKMLAKAKAYSFLYQYSGCPIISKMALWVLRHTQHVDLRPLLNSGTMNEYDRGTLLRALEHKDELLAVASKQPSLNTRLLMEEKYGVTWDTQKRLENWFDKASYEPMPTEYIKDLVPGSWVDYGERYTALLSMPDLRTAMVA